MTKAHWVKNQKLVKAWCDYIYDIYWTCSNCGYRPYEGTDCDRKKHLSNFCPECGKKMEYSE